jgi:SAM-dependent methyltransferase
MSGPLSWKDRVLMDWFYRRKLSDFIDPAQRVGWMSSKSQNARFETFLQIGALEGKRILDVGCGLGGFYGYLQSEGWTGSYTGFDRMSEMVKDASQRYPGVRFERLDIAEQEPAERWDYVFMSGLFNRRVKDNWGWISQVVGSAYRLSQRGTAFNLLSDTHPDQDGDFFYASQGDLERFAASLAPGRWRTAPCALPHDMTVFLYP